MRILRYVVHTSVPTFESQGWKSHGQMMGHHGQYACLMEKIDGFRSGFDRRGRGEEGQEDQGLDKVVQENT